MRCCGSEMRFVFGRFLCVRCGAVSYYTYRKILKPTKKEHMGFANKVTHHPLHY